MKTKQWIALFGMAAILLACSKEKMSVEEVKSSFSSNTWKVGLFNDSGTVKTTVYENYVFTFNSNGTVSVALDSLTFNGSWSVDDDDESDDDVEDDQYEHLEVNISLSNEMLDDLNDDYDVVSISNNTIELKDDDDGGTTDLLNLQKN